MIIVTVPVNMDESIQYHPLACSGYENARYHTFWNACDGSTYLDFYGLKVPRAYPYIGSLSSYLYTPFFTLSPAILTQRVTGVLFLILILWFVSRLERGDPIAALVIFGLSFPLLYQLIADTGPVRFGLTMVVLTPWLVRIIVDTRRVWLRVALSGLLGVLLFLAVEDKPFFLYLIPSVAALTLAYNCDGPGGLLDNIRRVGIRTWISTATFCGLILLYLLGARTNEGDRYVFALMREVKQLSIKDELIAMVSYLTNVEKFTSMVFERRQFKLLNVTMTVSIWLWGWIFVWKALANVSAQQRKLLFTLSAVVLAVLSILLVRNTWTGHHFIYCFVLGLLLVCQAVSRRANTRSSFLVAYALVGCVVATELKYFEPGKASSWERYKIFDYLRQKDVAQSNIIVHMSHGTYYVASLYGAAPQLSIQVASLDRTTSTRILELAQKVKRRVLCVCRGAGCDADSLSRGFLDELTFAEVPLGNVDWKVYLGTRIRTRGGLSITLSD